LVSIPIIGVLDVFFPVNSQGAKHNCADADPTQPPRANKTQP
jgi:hypothetical protein